MEKTVLGSLVGDIVGSGFYNEQVAQSMGAPFDQPTQYELVDCTVENEAADEEAAEEEKDPDGEKAAADGE